MQVISCPIHSAEKPPDGERQNKRDALSFVSIVLSRSVPQPSEKLWWELRGFVNGLLTGVFGKRHLTHTHSGVCQLPAPGLGSLLTVPIVFTMPAFQRHNWWKLRRLSEPPPPWFARLPIVSGPPVSVHRVPRSPYSRPHPRSSQ